MTSRAPGRGKLGPGSGEGLKDPEEPFSWFPKLGEKI